MSEDDAVNNRYPVNHDGYLGDDRYVSYEKMYNERFNVLRKAYERFKGKCVSAKLTLDKYLTTSVLIILLRIMHIGLRITQCLCL